MFLKRILAYATFAAVAVGLIYLFVGALRQSQTIAKGACLALKPEPQNREAPAFELPGLDGQKKSLASLRGKVVLLHFWATWCPPCIEELPSLYRLLGAVTNKDFALQTISVDDTADIIKKFFAANKVPPLPLLHDPSKKVALAYGTTKFPETYLIDKKGRVRFRFVNKRDWSSPAALTCIRSQLD